MEKPKKEEVYQPKEHCKHEDECYVWQEGYNRACEKWELWLAEQVMGLKKKLGVENYSGDDAFWVKQHDEVIDHATVIIARLKAEIEELKDSKGFYATENDALRLELADLRKWKGVGE